MNNWDIDGFGRDVKHTIQDAINTGDFSRLSRNINDTVSRAFGAGDAPDIKLSHDHTEYNQGQGNYNQGQGGYNQGHGAYNQQGYGQQGTSGFGTSQFGNGNQQNGSNMFNRGKERMANKRAMKQNGANNINLPAYRSVTGKNLLSIMAMIAGYGIGGLLLFSGAITGVSAPVIGASVAITTIGTLGVTAIPFFGLGIFGTFLYKKCKRFKGYMSIIGTRQVCNIEELARSSGKKEKAIAGDVEKFINQGWFCQGHLDDNRKCLMLTHKAYDEYKQIMAQRSANAERQAVAEAERKARAARHETLDPEIRDLIKQGEEYIKTIRKVNDLVPGEEVSNKMYKMEDLVRRIFKRVEEKPEQADDLKRLMNYYLPTSIKLLEAYAEMDQQTVQGENIINSKKEIEDTLDTLNIAYEKFLDDMFRDTAWDVSSDVSVLKTMLAREGLTDEDMDINKN